MRDLTTCITTSQRCLQATLHNDADQDVATGVERTASQRRASAPGLGDAATPLGSGCGLGSLAGPVLSRLGAPLVDNHRSSRNLGRAPGLGDAATPLGSGCGLGSLA